MIWFINSRFVCLLCCSQNIQYTELVVWTLVVRPSVLVETTQYIAVVNSALNLRCLRSGHPFPTIRWRLQLCNGSNPCLPRSDTASWKHVSDSSNYIQVRYPLATILLAYLFEWITEYDLNSRCFAELDILFDILILELFNYSIE